MKINSGNRTWTTFLQKNWDSLLITIFVLTYLYWVTLGNLQLLNHPYAWEPDEIDDIESISRLFTSVSTGKFYEEVIQNDFHSVHGLITLYIPGVFSIIPKAIWGDPGTLFTMRMMSALFLLCSYLIFTFCFFQNKWLRISTFLFFMAMPYTGMFATWPRCESYQFLFISLFFLLQHKTKYQSNSSYLFLGMALISRISTVVFVPVAFAAAIRWKPFNWRSIIKKVSFFWLGCVVSNPFLIAPSHIIDFVNRKFFLIYKDTGVKEWVTFSYWMNDIIKSYFGSVYLFYFIVSLLLCITIIIKKIFRDPSGYTKTYWYIFSIVSMSGVFLIASEVKTDTFWYLQFYLCLSFFSMCVYISQINHPWAKKIFVLPVILCSAFVYAHSLSQKGFITAKLEIENSENFQTRFRNYQQTKAALSLLCAEKKIKHFKVRTLADQFTLKSTRCYTAVPLWSPGPFYQMDDQPDVIVFDYERYIPESDYNHTKDGDSPIKDESIRNYYRLVSPRNGGQCHENCYVGFMISKQLSLFLRENMLENARLKAISKRFNNK